MHDSINHVDQLEVGGDEKEPQAELKRKPSSEKSFLSELTLTKSTLEAFLVFAQIFFLLQVFFLDNFSICPPALQGSLSRSNQGGPKMEPPEKSKTIILR